MTARPRFLWRSVGAAGPFRERLEVWADGACVDDNACAVELGGERQDGGRNWYLWGRLADEARGTPVPDARRVGASLVFGDKRAAKQWAEQRWAEG